jgi:hypothetical protein
MFHPVAAERVDALDVLQSRHKWLKENNRFRSQCGALETISNQGIRKPSHGIRRAIGRELSYRSLLLPGPRQQRPELLSQYPGGVSLDLLRRKR